MNDDVFDGDVEHRLRRAERRLRAAALDAQARDWTAERPDRIGFPRLAQAYTEVRTAADRYAAPPPAGDGPTVLAGGLTWIGAAVLVLLLVDHPAAPPALAAATVTGALAAQVAVSALVWARKLRARRRAAVPAPIDDPHLYADLTRRLEACAAAARADPSEHRRAAATDLARALDWLAAARD